MALKVADDCSVLIFDGREEFTFSGFAVVGFKHFVFPRVRPAQEFLDFRFCAFIVTVEEAVADDEELLEDDTPPR